MNLHAKAATNSLTCCWSLWDDKSSLP